MKAKNANLQKAKKEANDEFYTQYEDIAKEIEHYKEHLKGKVVYCNCDIPHFSNFHKYFLDNFKELELKKLIVTGYVKNGNGKCSIYDGEKSTDYDLLGDGDFRGDECIDMLQKADVVITNPPFSLFREFIKVVVENDKDFIVVGNMNAITYREIFPLIMSDKIYMGRHFNKSVVFSIPDNYVSKIKERDSMGRKLGIVPAITWFTSFNVREDDYLRLTKEYSSLNYPKYYNYDAINVDKTKDIPKGYDGVMGVPISFLDKYNPNQFEIIGLGMSKLGMSVGVRKYTDEHKHYRKVTQKRGTADGDLYMIINNIVVVPYARILIKRKG